MKKEIKELKIFKKQNEIKQVQRRKKFSAESITAIRGDIKI